MLLEFTLKLIKTHFLSLVLFFSVLSVAGQSHQGFNYQTILRDATGNVIPLADISLQINIIKGSPDGDIIYSEIHEAITNASGLVNLIIGQGNPVSGVFQDINWSTGSHFFEVAVDIDKNDQFVSIGISQFLSVPYSRHADISTGLQVLTSEERDAIVNPVKGMQIFNSSTNCLNYYSGITWFETCGDCTPFPSQADAGTDQVILDDSTLVYLAANVPQYGVGVWIVLNGEGGVFEDINDPNTLFSGMSCESYLLQWTIENFCGNTSDEVNIHFNSTPTVANAGEDQWYVDGTWAELQGNTPEIGEGHWSVVQGEGGNIMDPADPGSLFFGLNNEVYCLVWEISTSCGVSTDSVFVSFGSGMICGLTNIVDQRDGNQYSTIQIGNQCWMKQNLAYLPDVSGASSGSTSSPRYYVYGYQGNSVEDAKATDNYQTYGALYNWPAATDACPAGWHLPTDAEFCTLAQFIDPSVNCQATGYLGTIAGGKMKTTGTLQNGDGFWQHPNTGATNESGFSTLPGGRRAPVNPAFDNLGYFGNYWTSSTNGSDRWGYILNNNEARIQRAYGTGDHGFMVRCIKNQMPLSE